MLKQHRRPPSRPTLPPLASNTFDQLENDFKAANEKSINDQPIAQLMTGYQDLLKQDALPASMRRIAEIRIATLKLRDEAKQEFVATRASQEKALERRKALEAEREEIQDRIKQNEIVVYAALGTLRTSSIQRGNLTLYRLTDPSSGRTVAYLRTNDPKYATLLGQFVGVKGSVSSDPALNMKMIDQPSEAAVVDQSKINKTITRADYSTQPCDRRPLGQHRRIIIRDRSTETGSQAPRLAPLFIWLESRLRDQPKLQVVQGVTPLCGDLGGGFGFPIDFP